MGHYFDRTANKAPPTPTPPPKKKKLEHECFCFTKKSIAFCEQMMLQADIDKQIHNQADDLFFTSHLDLPGLIYINLLYSLQH